MPHSASLRQCGLFRGFVNMPLIPPGACARRAHFPCQLPSPPPPPSLCPGLARDPRQRKESRRPDKSLEALVQVIGALGIRGGHGHAHGGIRDACHALVLEQGAPVARASLDALHKWVGIEDDDGARLALETDLYGCIS